MNQPAATLFDSHIHLDDQVFNETRGILLKEARQKNIHAWLVPATTAASFPAIQQLCATERGCFPAYGLHPYFINSHTEAHLTILEEALEGASAVGECGLDLMMPEPQFEQQLIIFKRHLTYANNMHLPLVIHARKSLDLVLKELKKYPSLTGVIHSFSGSQQQALQLIERGFYLGFGGAVTYPRAKRLRAILAALPKEWLLLETDAPFQPSAFADALHRPSDLYAIAKEVANIRQESLQSISKQTTKNAHKLFNL